MAASVYTFCPRCATALQAKMMSDRVRPVCPACGFIQFHDPKVAVIGLVTCNGHVLLTQRAVNPEIGKWALPGGFMDAGEMPEEALQRELMEEIGLQIVVEGLIVILPMLVNNKDARDIATHDNEIPAGQVNNGIVLAYRAAPRSGKLEPLQANDDVQDAQWFAPGNIPPALAFESTHKLIAMWRDR